MVLGDQGSNFANHGYRVVAVNQASGAEQWRWELSEGTVQIIAATSGIGGIAVLNGTDNFVFVDRSG
jgi:hypothetical protein